MSEQKKKQLKPEIMVSTIEQFLLQRGWFKPDAFNGKKLRESKFRFYEISRDHIEPIMIIGKDVTLLSENEAIKYVMECGLDPEVVSNLDAVYSGIEKAAMLASTAKSVYDTLAKKESLRCKEKIKKMAFKSDDSLTFFRLGFDPTDEILPCPNWDKTMSNFTNEDAVRMFIGSLFVDNADRSQYLWFFGDGYNGKSILIQVLQKILGDLNCTIEQVPRTDGEKRFWSNGIIGKRLVFFDECSQLNFVASEFFKTLTGLGICKVERKGGAAFNTELFAKFIFTSNDKPEISSKKSDQRRAIICTGKQELSFDPEVIPNLLKESDHFLNNAIALYNFHCPDGRPIPADNSEAIALAKLNEEEIASWVEHNFVLDQTTSMLVSDFRHRIRISKLNHHKVTPNKIYDYLKRIGVERYEDKKRDSPTLNKTLLKGIKPKINVATSYGD